MTKKKKFTEKETGLRVVDEWSGNILPAKFPSDTTRVSFSNMNRQDADCLIELRFIASQFNRMVEEVHKKGYVIELYTMRSHAGMYSPTVNFDLYKKRKGK